MTKQVAAVFLLFILSSFSANAQAPDLVSLAKVRTAALAVHATSSVSCGDGSEGTCIRTDSDVIGTVTSIVNATDIWKHFEKADATMADAIFEFTLRDAKETHGSIELYVRDADSNKILYSESRSIVVLENDITRIVSHFLKAFEDAKKRLPSGKKR